MKRLCVYSGSNPGKNDKYSELTKKLGKVLVQNGIDLVYGGSKIGLMGRIAKEVSNNGGHVIGVIPKGLFVDDMINENLAELIMTEDLSARKKKMEELSDGFIALPGGLGTYEELFEVLSWAQLGLHKKPIGILNIDHFYDPLLELLKNTCKEGFMKESNLKLLLVSDDPLELLEMMKTYTPPVMEKKWDEMPEKSN
ncbi:MAG: TIGR00730 family Rossman fold protein [Clostridium sp.]|nr:TIGR00730 family Rossman fold protein [Clostridium sp.]